MKYIMFEVQADGYKKLVPIIFPKDLIHDEVSDVMTQLIGKSLGGS